MDIVKSKILIKVTINIVHYLIHFLYVFKFFLLNMSIFSRKKIKFSSVKQSFDPLDKLKCIYVHIPKTAGVTINKLLYGNMGVGHFNIFDYFKFYSPKEFKSYYKFCFVRNPYDRLVSAYFFLKKNGINSLDKKFNEDFLTNCNSFEDFVKNYLKNDEVKNYIHFVPQYKFVTFFNILMVNRVCHFENLDVELQVVLDLFSIENFSIPKLNKTKREKLYNEFYNTEMKEIVYSHYKKDFILFNYSK